MTDAVQRLMDVLEEEVDRDGGEVDAFQLLGRLELAEARLVALRSLLETRLGVSPEEIDAAEESAIETQASAREPAVVGHG